MTTLVVGKTVKMPCMRAGLCYYEEKPGAPEETILLTNETLEKMAKSSFGIPVVVHHKKVDSDNVETVTVGRVADMHLNGEVWDMHFVVDDEDAVRCLEKGWGISSAYAVTESREGGTLNGVKYNREVTGAKYQHLAIVEHPRYEMARGPIFYNSAPEKVLRDVSETSNINTIVSKTSEGTKMLSKIWRRLTNVEEVKENEQGSCFVMLNGVKKPINELVEELHTMENAKETVLDAVDEVEIGGQKMTVGDLVTRYNAAVEKKNGSKKNEEPKEKDEDKKKENEEDEDKKKEEEKKENEAAKENFDALKQTKENAAAVPQNDDVSQGFVTIREKVEAGRKAYGSAK